MLEKGFTQIRKIDENVPAILFINTNVREMADSKIINDLLGREFYNFVTQKFERDGESIFKKFWRCTSVCRRYSL